jgi:hypothetical protein
MAFLTVRVKAKHGFVRRELVGERLVVGRSLGAAVIIDHALTSQQHCAIVRREDRWLVEDLGSRNGTWVNKVRVPPLGTLPLDERDIVKAGGARLTFHDRPLPVEPAPDSPAARRKDRRITAAPAWVSSAAVHVLLLLSCGTFVVTRLGHDEAGAELRIIALDAHRDDRPVMRRKQDTPEPTTVTIEPETDPAEQMAFRIGDIDLAVTQEEIVPDSAAADDLPSAIDSTNDDVALGMSFISIGAGGGSSALGGLFGNRHGLGKQRALKRYGGNAASEDAVSASLKWLRKHQSPDGRWSFYSGAQRCRDEPRCDGSFEYYDDNGDTAMTAYAVLCFVGAGFDQRTPSTYQLTVKRAVQFLCSTQRDDGSWGSNNYAVATATMALAEAAAMAHDDVAMIYARKGVECLVARQGRTATHPYGVGWDYVGPSPARSDASVTGWCVMALKSAYAAGLDTGDSLRGARSWLDAAWAAANRGRQPPRDPLRSTSAFPYAYDAVSNTGDRGRLTFVAALCAPYLGYRTDDLKLQSLYNTLEAPTRYPTSTYELYYSTLALFQAGGERWRRWNERVRDLLVRAQRRGPGCYTGSWDPGVDVGGGSTFGGRLMATVFCCLSLEVYYRYEKRP